MDLGIAGKRAMVAAATQGIGLACAKALADEGCQVAICGRSQGKFEEALAEIGHGATASVCDVTDPASIEAWFAEAGPPDILVTSTGGPPPGKWPELTDEQWQIGFESTIMNVVRMVRLAAPGMAERGWGRIIHLTSIAAAEPSEILPISSTLRTGIRSLTRLQATELAPSGVTVNAVLPGHTLTGRQTELAEKIASDEGITPEQALERRADEIPIGRMAEPAEIASAVAFFAGRQAASITGASLLVDGGSAKGAF